MELQQLEEAEAGGASFFTSSFGERVRNKVLYAVGDASGDHHKNVLLDAYDLMLRDQGVTFLGYKRDPVADILGFAGACDDDAFPDLIEALLLAMEKQDRNSFMTPAAPRFEQFHGAVNAILREHRVSFELIGAEMFDIESQVMHHDVVAPALRLLRSQRGWEAVESAFRDALAELSDGKPGDAITDAGTALQEALRAVGAKGDQLGNLIASARQQHLLSPHDTPLVTAIERALHWVAAERSQNGDSHLVTDADMDDAWLIVHVVGALIVRLQGGLRPQPG
jgi:hypothetical protein